MSYNGWSNRATWNVNLWLNNDESMYRRLQEATKWAKSHHGETITGAELGNAIKTTCEELWPTGQTPDGCSLGDVNWPEIGASELEG